MKVKDKTVEKLLEKYKEISLLGDISAMLSWDLNVNLPANAIENRAEQSAYMAQLITDKWLDHDFKKLLTKANNIKKLKLEEVAVVRNLNYAAKFYHNAPKRVIVEFEETSSHAYVAWTEARKKNDFSIFSPHLSKMVKLNQIIAKHYGFKDNPYDALLDLHEPGLTTIEAKKMFDQLTPKLIELLKKIKKSKEYKQQSKNNLFSNEVYTRENQEQLCNFVLRKIGYDFETGRMDVSPHPFTTQLGSSDVRITNRYNMADFRESLSVATHEGGHALYEQGVKPEYSNTPLKGGASLGIHESQSRFWENMVGRSESFSKFLTPILHTLFNKSLDKTNSNVVYKLLNQVKPSLIRTEADEVTYNLHVAIRFEIERDLVNGQINVVDIPKIWSGKMVKYLGVTPDGDSNGCLQDVHWSSGPMGYFPTYTLGNLYSAQFANSMKKEIDIDSSIEKGELGTILSWLRTNIYTHGSLYLPPELVKKVTGEKLNPKYFVSYINSKYKKLYKL
ncbi:carboxypeptidase M32 [Candidatus Microgenomates bacterium]|nr:carboxypeptidase M32 [Candidatus Microgenomates bacterium]